MQAADGRGVGRGEGPGRSAGRGRGPGRGRSTGGRAGASTSSCRMTGPVWQAWRRLDWAPPPSPGSLRVSTTFWHGFADMHLIKDAEVVIRAGRGRLDRDDRRPSAASMRPRRCGTARSGYGRPTIAEAVAEQLATVAAYSSFGAYTTEATVAARRTPVGARADGRRGRLPRLRRLGRRRHGGQARPALLGRRRPARRSGSSCRASTATTGCTRGARRWPASRPTRRATAARSSTRS